MSFNALGKRPNLYRAGIGQQPMRRPLTAAEQLGSSLTINGTPVTSSIRYVGSSAGASTWAASVGSELSLVSTGTDPNLGATTSFTKAPAVTAVDFVAGKVYQAPDNTTGDVTTEDVAIEFVYKHSASESSKRVIGKRGTAALAGWEVVTITASDRIRFAIGDGITSVNVTSAALTVGNSYHIMAFNDRSVVGTNGAQIYVNGVLSASASNTVLLSLTVAKPLTLGSDSDAANKCQQELAVVQMWKLDAWFAGGAQNGTDWAAVALARYNSIV